jgi:hypothetical protein
VKCSGEGKMEEDGSVVIELTEGLPISCQDHSVLSLNPRYSSQISRSQTNGCSRIRSVAGCWLLAGSRGVTKSMWFEDGGGAFILSKP